jgi:hypothetical protein
MPRTALRFWLTSCKSCTAGATFCALLLRAGEGGAGVRAEIGLQRRRSSGRPSVERQKEANREYVLVATHRICKKKETLKGGLRC